MRVKYQSAKVLTLISGTERSREKNLALLIEKAKASHLGIVPDNWSSMRWDVTATFRPKTRPGKGRKKLCLNFTRDRLTAGANDMDFRAPYADLIKALVVLRYEAKPRTLGALQQFVDVYRQLYECIPANQNELRLLTPEHFDLASQHIQTRFARSTAKKMIGRLEELADLLDANNLVSGQLNFRCRRTLPSGGDADISKQRYDAPETLGKAIDKRVSVQVLCAIGQLYLAIPMSQTADALLVRLVMLLALVGRRIGEMLSLADQEVQFDIHGKPFLIYFPQKKSFGILKVPSERMWLIPQSLTLIETLLGDIKTLTQKARMIAKNVIAAWGPDLSTLPDQEWLSAKDLSLWLGSSTNSTTQWARQRSIPFVIVKHKCLYRRADIECALRPEAISGPVMTTSSIQKELYVSDLLFIAPLGTFHRKKAGKPYASAPVTEGQVRDFLSMRENMKNAFERYGLLKNNEALRTNSHSFRHFLNDLLDRGGMPLLAQTAWFGRLNPLQTTEYHATSTAQRVLEASKYIARLDADKASALSHTQPPVTFNQMKQLGQQRPIQDLGDGACSHHLRQAPCPHSLKAPATSAEYYWLGSEKDAATETLRQIHMNEGLLDLTMARAIDNKFAEPWVEHYRTRIQQLKKE